MLLCCRIRHGRKVAFNVVVAVVVCCVFTLAVVMGNRLAVRRNLVTLAGDSKLITFHSTVNWGLGNYLFAFASTLSLATAANEVLGGSSWTVCFDRRSPMREAFDELREWPACEPQDMFDQLEAKQLKETAYGRFDQDLSAILTSSSTALKHVVVERFLQSWKYFANFESRIRQLFQFTHVIQRQAHAELSDVIEQHLGCVGCYDNGDIITVGIHVRRGDMAHDDRLKKMGYTVADEDYLMRAMNYMQRKVSDDNSDRQKSVVFVVCSDDIAWCRRHLSAARDHQHVVYVSTGDSLVDLAVLSQCQHSIVTVGTFGWWSAWLANGTTVYYKDWPTSDSLLAKSISHSDYFYPNWIPL